MDFSPILIIVMMKLDLSGDIMKNKAIYLLFAACLAMTACGKTADNVQESLTGEITASSCSETVSENCKPDKDIAAAIEKKKTELDSTDEPFGVTDIYFGTRFDYNNDGYDDRVILYSLYAQFEFVIINSQNADILFGERIIAPLFSQTKIEVYRCSDSEYAFKITDRIEKSQISCINETVQIISPLGNSVFDAVYDCDTNEFHHAYIGSYTEYDYERYIQKQNELLGGCEYCMDIKFEPYLE